MVFPGWGPFNDRPTTKTFRQQPHTPSGVPGLGPGGRQRFLRHVSAPQAACRPRAAPAPPPQGTPRAQRPRGGLPGRRPHFLPGFSGRYLPGGDGDACAAELGAGFEGSHRLLFLLLPPSPGQLPPNFSSGAPPLREAQTPSLPLDLPKAFGAVSC